MRPIELFPLFIGILVSSLTLASMGHSASNIQFSVVYTNDVLGEVEPCG
jgi:hypothetical protein